MLFKNNLLRSMKLKLKLNYRSSIVFGNILMAILNLMPNPFPHKKKHAFFEVIDGKMSRVICNHVL